MTKEIGPRERQLREQREARHAAAQVPRPTIKALAQQITKAAKKRGKPRKARK